MTISFPSTEYFTALQRRWRPAKINFAASVYRYDLRREYRRERRARNFILEFEVFDLKNISEVPALDLKKLDFAIQGDAPVWREMIENIKRNGQADSSHDINTLAHFGERLKIVYDDPTARQTLPFMESIQNFSTSRASST